jgi:FtsZ-interacting cell division protein ZipA
MYIQLIVDILIFVICVYAIYRLLFREHRQKRIETKKLLKEQKLQELKEKEKDLKEEVVVTEELIDTKKDVTKLNRELKKLDEKIPEEV